jgi:osmoprotectant transport system permease protein
MGYDERQLLREIELPLASPVMLVGIRLAYVQVIATTAIGAIVTNGGGLGRFVVDGFATGRAGRAEVLAGALLLAGLTLAVEGMMALAERRVVPAGVRSDRGVEQVAGQTGAAG